MEKSEITLEIYDKREKVLFSVFVKRIGSNKYKMLENSICNSKLNLGAEFETKINQEGKSEILRITKDSDYITRRFILSPKLKQSDYLMLGEELTKRGGFWQVDFGSIAIVNIPKNFEFDVDQVLKDLEIPITEIIE